MATPVTEDTIVALSSAPGPGARAIIRLSGPDAQRLAGTVFQSDGAIDGTERCWHPGRLSVAGSLLPARAYVWRAPRSYTGQDIVELHTISCPPLLDQLVASLLDNGGRAAAGGEFTLRAFLAGKLDLAQAESVLGVIEARDRKELKAALTQLAGGITRPLEGLREELINLLADVEAGLDFAEEDIQFADRGILLGRLAHGLARLTLLQKQLDQRLLNNRVFRVVLAGRPNVGKSALFNALAGRPSALVSAEPGTTRDYLVHSLQIKGMSIELVDTAGWQNPTDDLDEQAQRLGQGETERSDLVLLCLEAGMTPSSDELRMRNRGGVPKVMTIATKCDRQPALPGLLATSALSGTGLEALRSALADEALAFAGLPGASSATRCRHHVEACLGKLRRAHGAVLFEEPPEVLALELRGALDEFGELVGAVYSDDLLDRIFSRFCIGK